MTDEELKELVASLAVHSRETDRLITKWGEESRRELEAWREESRRELEAWREESRLKAAEWDRNMEAWREESRRELEAWREERRLASEKADAWFEKMRKSHEETECLVRENGKQIGTMSDNDGKHAEQYFQYIFDKKLEFGGMKYDKMLPNLECFNKDRIIQMEFDIVLVNCQSVAIIETKSSIRSDFIWDLVKDRLPVFRRFFPEYNDRKAYLGIAGFSFSKKVLKQAEKYGVGIIRQVGDSVEVKTDNLKAY